MLQKHNRRTLGCSRIFDSEDVQNVVIICSNLVAFMIEALFSGQIKERFEIIGVLSFEIFITHPLVDSIGAEN